MHDPRHPKPPGQQGPRRLQYLVDDDVGTPILGHRDQVGEPRERRPAEQRHHPVHHLLLLGQVRIRPHRLVRGPRLCPRRSDGADIKPATGQRTEQVRARGDPHVVAGALGRPHQRQHRQHVPVRRARREQHSCHGRQRVTWALHRSTDFAAQLVGDDRPYLVGDLVGDDRLHVVRCVDPFEHSRREPLDVRRLDLGHEPLVLRAGQDVVLEALGLGRQVGDGDGRLVADEPLGRGEGLEVADPLEGGLVRLAVGLVPLRREGRGGPTTARRGTSSPAAPCRRPGRDVRWRRGRRADRRRRHRPARTAGRSPRRRGAGAGLGSRPRGAGPRSPCRCHPRCVGRRRTPGSRVPAAPANDLALLRGTKLPSEIEPCR